MSARNRLVAVVAGLALAAVLAAAGWKLYRHLYFDLTPAYQVSEFLLRAARTRPLTADEFDRALVLCDCGERVVEYRMYAAVAVAVSKSPEFRPKALKLFDRLAADPSDPQRQAAAAVQLKRLTNAPPAAP